MVALSPSPRRLRTPSWVDLRLVIGIVLVLGSVLLGAALVSSADSTSRMWAVSRDLAAGSVLTSGDLTPVRVRLPSGSAAYVAAGTDVVGRTVSGQLHSGELLPRALISSTAPATTVTVPLGADDAPEVHRGQRIALWISTRTCTAVPVLADVTVQDVRSGGGGAFSSGAGQGVVVRVPAGLATRLVTALAVDGAVIRAGVLDGPPVAQANDALAPLEPCLGKAQ